MFLPGLLKGLPGLIGWAELIEKLGRERRFLLGLKHKKNKKARLIGLWLPSEHPGRGCCLLGSVGAGGAPMVARLTGGEGGEKAALGAVADGAAGISVRSVERRVTTINSSERSSKAFSGGRRLGEDDT
jgi:hypothetical protein